MMAAHAHDETWVELDLLLQEIYRRYHYDFRSYARSSLHRRIAHAQSSLGSSSVKQLRESVIRDPRAFAELLRYLTVQVSDCFRDPAYCRILRKEVMPHLATFPSLKIWAAGCGTGEEAYSIGLILQEEGLLDRSLIHATDIDAESLRAAEAGIYRLDRVRGFSENTFTPAVERRFRTITRSHTLGPYSAHCYASMSCFLITAWPPTPRLPKCNSCPVAMSSSTSNRSCRTERSVCSVSDVRLPEMSGDEFAARLRGSQPDLKVIFVSGLPEAPAGASAFLQKPIDVDALTQVIGRVLV